MTRPIRGTTPKTKSGPFWVEWTNQHAPNSSRIEDLAEPFRSDVIAFVAALKNAGAAAHVSATLRDPRRAYLFHWCWLIGLCRSAPGAATVMPGVDT